MRVTNLTEKSDVYTCNVYMVRGAFNYIENMNTLIDAGRDESVLSAIDGIYTGVGKKKVDQIVLTHSHYDHASLLPVLKEKYSSKTFAFTNHLEGIDYVLKDRDTIRIGDLEFIVIHTPGHSNDSICLYSEEAEALFCGDTDFLHLKEDKNYEAQFLNGLRYLANKPINTLYPGHGAPVCRNITQLINAFITT